MNKVWLVIKREYLYNLRRPAFLFAALGTPIFFIAIFVLSIVITSETQRDVADLTQVGYVDNAGVLNAGMMLEDYPDLFSAYPDETAARAALDDGTVDGYAVIAENYMQSGVVNLYSYDGLPENMRSVVDQLITLNLTQGVELGLPQNLVLDSLEMTVQLGEGGRELNDEALIGLIIFPLIFAIVFVMATQFTSGFLMSGLVDERTNRIMEVLVTSVTPGQLLTGKLIGLFLLGLTQLTIWVGAGLAVSLLGRDVEILSGVILTPDMVIFGLIYFVLGYLLVASVMAGIGAIVNSEQESRQMAFFITFPLFVPYFFLVQFLLEPNDTIPVVLSLIPFTAPMSMMMRLGVTTVPAWQIAASIGLLLLTTVVFTWGSIKVFRWGLLLYGKKLRPREILAVLRGNPYAYSDPVIETTGQAVKETSR
ncbi:MAG: ABC transporter permease [Aggregatilineales bacterium]